MNPPGIAIPFVKASACANDFLIIDAMDVDEMQLPADLAGFSRRICDRHQGVGADGVEWLFPARDADVGRGCSMLMDPRLKSRAMARAAWRLISVPKSLGKMSRFVLGLE
jgi:hypothetical protein